MGLITTQASVRCLDLWNGSSNNAAPTNWNQPSYDDSLWVTSTVPTLDPGDIWATVYSPSRSLVPLSSLPGPAEPLWPQSTPRDSAQCSLFRVHATMNSPAFLTHTEYSPLEATGTGVSLWLNGVDISSSWQGSDFAMFLLSFAAVNGDNVFAFCVSPGAFTPSAGGLPHNRWDATAWYAFEISGSFGKSTAHASIQIIS